jgi:microcystin-dependent protein
MKQFYITISALVFSTIIFAQGISVQGIARNIASSALADTTLPFTFSIAQDDNTVLYSETQSITTDNFGVFSHIVSTGNPLTSSFNNVDFSIPDLKIKVSVSYSGNQIEVYNLPFQYTPYAHFAKKAALAINAINATNATNAADGVPAGSIMPYIGAVAPAGWVLCEGQILPNDTEHSALRSLVGGRAPNLLGMFLRGTGTNPRSASYAGPSLKGFQDDSFESHGHGVTVTVSNAGVHTHSIIQLPQDNQTGSNKDGQSLTNSVNKDEEFASISGGGNAISSAGNHNHSASGSIANTGDGETRPVSYGVTYIIKL